MHTEQTNTKTKKRKAGKNKTPATGPRQYKPRVPHGPNGMKLKQVQYHQLSGPIAIYHFQASYISVSNFRSLLKRQEHGYVTTLLNVDPLFYKPIIDGDEMPASCLEVGYLSDVFVAGGSALGFRLGNGMVEWLCFDRDIKASILDQIDVGTDMYRMLFEHVGDTLRPEMGPNRRVLGSTEHRDWFGCLKGAGRKPARLSITWRNYGTALQQEHLRLREKRERDERETNGEEVVEEQEDRDAKEEQEQEDEFAEEYADDSGVHGEGRLPNGEEYREDQGTEMHDPDHFDHLQGLAGEVSESQEVNDNPIPFTFYHPDIAPTIEKHTPFIYRDPVHADNDATPSRPPKAKHSRSPSSDSMLSESSGNAPRLQSAPSAELKKLVTMGGGFVGRAKSC
jgi:hypothetical protein